MRPYLRDPSSVRHLRSGHLAFEVSVHCSCCVDCFLVKQMRRGATEQCSAHPSSALDRIRRRSLGYGGLGLRRLRRAFRPCAGQLGVASRRVNVTPTVDLYGGASRYIPWNQNCFLLLVLDWVFASLFWCPDAVPSLTQRPQTQPMHFMRLEHNSPSTLDIPNVKQAFYAHQF